MLDHSVEGDQQLAHAGGQGNFAAFAGLHQPLIEGLDHGVMADRR